MEPEVEEERPVLVRFEELNRLGHDDVRRRAFELAGRLAVANEVGRVEVAGRGVVLRVQPVVETRLARRAFAAVGLAVEVPLAGVTGPIAGFLEQLGDRHFAGSQEDAAVRRNPVTDAEAVGDPPGQQAGARGGTDRGRRIAVREFDPFCRELVEVRRADLRVGEAAQVAVAEVIAQEDDDVGLLRGDGGAAPEGEETQLTRRRRSKWIRKGSFMASPVVFL